jgi:kynurenine formamidase
VSQRYLELAKPINNWGRWGDSDERGTLNLLDNKAVRRGIDAVVDGRTRSLAVRLAKDGLQSGVIKGRDNPQHTMVWVNKAITGDDDVFATSDDRLDLGLQSATHWDALAHVSRGGQLWNGHPADAITERGASKCGIDKVGTILGRGVLLDVAAARGVNRLAGNHVVTGEDLDEALDFAQVTLEPGDILLVRTGQMALFHEGDREAYAFPAPGLGVSCPAWFHARDVAAIATDNLACEIFPAEHEDLFLPVHLLHLVDMGMLQGQNWDLEGLSEDCADVGRYSFLLSATPEPVERGVGGLVNPVVTM